MARAECNVCHFVFPVIDAALQDAAFDVVCPQCGTPVPRGNLSRKTPGPDASRPPSGTSGGAMPVSGAQDDARITGQRAGETRPHSTTPAADGRQHTRMREAEQGAVSDSAVEGTPAPPTPPRDEEASRPRSLWEVMQAAGTRAPAAVETAGGRTVAPEDGGAAAATNSQQAHEGDSGGETVSPERRPAGPVPEASAAENMGPSPSPPQPAAVMDSQRMPAQPQHSPGGAVPPVEPWSTARGRSPQPPHSPAQPPRQPLRPPPAPSHVAEAPGDGDAVPADPSLPVVREDVPRQRVMGRLERLRQLAERRAVWALRAGLLGVLLCPLALSGAAWTPYPAGLVGIAAVTLGLSVLFGRGVRRLSRRFVFQAVSGLLAGLVAMFVGPLWLQGLGQRHVAEKNRELAAAHLKQIGAALDAYLDAHGHFPAGGIFRIQDDTATPMHGWMTALLPYLGHETLHRQVDFDRPYDDPVNRPVFKRVIPEFTVPDASVRYTSEGLAAAHFAGVGGERIDRERGVVGLGVFGPNSRVKAADVTDGLSQTIVAGQIADALPPWGSAENWREIGAGLNQGHRGFGNPSRTGALFLFADGSVRFFSNRTPRDLLIRLSTRDGGDGVDPEEMRAEGRP